MRLLTPLLALRGAILASAAVVPLGRSPSTSGIGHSEQPEVRQVAAKPVFAHYMIGGISDEHCKKDIDDARELGLDAFALNFDQFTDWSEGTVSQLFDYADQVGFKLFFSFDMGSSYFNTPSQFADYLRQHLDRPSYYNYNGKALVSTFGGERVSGDQWNELRGLVGGHDILIIPSFYEGTPSPSFFDQNSALDGIFNWNAWATVGEGKVVVPARDDEVYQQSAKASGKLFMMGLSPLQFKHIDGGQNWYRRGEQNLEYRFEQVLQMQPDMLEVQTWNDAGESHYMGNIWPEPIQGSAIPDYTDGYDHKGYWEVLESFIAAWKRGDTNTSRMFPTNGKAAQGVFWHHTLLRDAACAPDRLGLGKPDGIDNVEDSVTGIILVAEGQSNLEVVALSGSQELGKATLNAGYNKFSFGGLRTGAVTVEVRNAGNAIVRGTGPIEVSNSGSVCNYNYQVVGLA